MDIETELRLLEQSKKDIKAFKTLYNYYLPKIYAYVMYMVEDKNVCEDIVSATFEKAMLNILNYEYKGYTFGSWLYAIARNLILDRGKLKTNISLDVLNDVIQCSEEYDPETTIQEDIRKEKLLNAISQLSNQAREVVMLRYINEFSIKETAVITGYTEDSIKSISKRAFDQLKEIIGDSL